MADLVRCGLILLAAGTSARMGRPKQLLPIKGTPLVRRVAEQLIAADIGPIVAVLGAGAMQIKPVLADLPLEIEINPDWGKGMGTSLGFGVRAMLNLFPEMSALIVAMADQPDLPAFHLRGMLDRYAQGNCTIVASTFDSREVPPVLFSAKWFPVLGKLEGDIGARTILRENHGEVATVRLMSNADLDTPADYEKFEREAS